MEIRKSIKDYLPPPPILLTYNWKCYWYRRLYKYVFNDKNKVNN